MKRASNFELLRILLIIFVIALHYNDSSRQGAFFFIENASILNKFFLYSMESLSLCAVNTFLCLSGFFLSGKDFVNVRKIIHIFTILFAYRIFSYLPWAITHHNLSLIGFVKCFIPSNYYANLYCVVVLLSPFLNRVTNKFDEKNYNLFMIMLLTLFSIIPTVTVYLPLSQSVSTISLYGNGRGFTIVNFILLYYVGGFIAKKNYSSITMSLMMYFASSLIICILMFVNRTAIIAYCNIFVVLQAASLIVIFKNFHFQSMIVNSIAKSVWGIFCIHVMFMRLYCKIFPIDLKTDLLSLLLHFTTCVLGAFVCSLIWDKICSIILIPVEKLFDKIRFFNKKISVEQV